MANNKSAIKRIRINKRNRLQNKFYRSSTRTLIRKYLKCLEEYNDSKNQSDKVNIKLLLNSLYSLLDKAVKKNIFHKNKAARKKSQLASKLKTC